jgi:hypothetical protein
MIMKSRVLMMLAIFFGLLLLFGNISWAGGGIGHRQIRQSKRVVHGVRNGQITDREFVRLNREQGRIQQYKNRALADGYMNPRERHKLPRMQDSASEHIYRAKHNHASHYAFKPNRKRLSFLHKPIYHGYYLSGTLLEPTWAFGWSVGWQ